MKYKGVLRVSFSIFAFYFFLMGMTLIVGPRFITHKAGELHVMILGMLRGAGGSILPYALLYLLVAWQPARLRPMFWLIASANIIAITLDITSVLMHEYEPSYALFDAPMELFSLVVIFIFCTSNKDTAGNSATTTS